MTDCLRADLHIIQNWIAPNSQVLDLGCGAGELLAYLQQHKQVIGYGLEIDQTQITAAISKGINVIEHNLDDGLQHFFDKSIDTVVMTQALQAVRRPDLLLDEMLRIGDKAIITFPNFGYWRTRFYLFFKGKMPMSETLPYHWYDTPNIHLCTYRDFELLCQAKGFYIHNKMVVDGQYQQNWRSKIWASMFGEFAIYQISRGEHIK